MKTPVLNAIAAFAAALVVGLASMPAWAQAAPASSSTPASDTPSIKVGTVIFADYTYQQSPTAKDAAGNEVNPSSFNVARAYINVTGNISHLVSFRVTPDITRMTTSGAGASTSLDGSMTYRLKYAYLQFSLDDWMPAGTWVRFGMQQTPFIDSVEGSYRYRFQGTTFPEREGYMASADFGATFRVAFPRNYGDIHLGVYNGEGYSRADPNGQKAFMVRVGVRPLPGHPVLRSWRVQGFWTRDSYMKNAPRNRSMFNTTFEHRYVNAGYDYLWTTDQVSSALVNGVDRFPTLEGNGWSIWITPKKPFESGSSLEALLRYDHMKPGGTAGATAITSPEGLSQRAIAGIAYWFPRQGGVSAALMVDYEQVKFSNWAPARTTQQRFFVHSLISF